MQTETPMTLYARKLVAEKGPIKGIGSKDVECIADGWGVKVRQPRKQRFFQLSKGRFVWSERLKAGHTAGGIVVMGATLPTTLSAAREAFRGRPVGDLLTLPDDIASALRSAVVTAVKYRPQEDISPSFLTVEYEYQ